MALVEMRLRSALKIVKRAEESAVDLVAEAQRELEATKTAVHAARAEAQQLGAAWLAAATQDAAEEIARRRAELVRVADRDEQQLGALEARLAAAHAEKQRAGIARHYGIVRALYPRLRAAIEAAAAVQGEILAARQAAVAQLGEHVTDLPIPKCAYAGFILPDLISLWVAEQERVWATRPAPVAQPPAPAKPAAKPRPMISTSSPAPAPRPARVVRDDPFPVDAQSQLVVFLKAGGQLPSGGLAAVGDKVALPAAQARALCERALADYYVPVPEV